MWTSPEAGWTSVQGARRTLLDWGGLSSALRLAPHGLAAPAAPRASRLLPSGLLLPHPAPTSAWAPGLQLHPEPIWFASRPRVLSSPSRHLSRTRPDPKPAAFKKNFPPKLSHPLWFTSALVSHQSYLLDHYWCPILPHTRNKQILLEIVLEILLDLTG